MYVRLSLLGGTIIFILGGLIALLWLPFWRVTQMDVAGVSTLSAGDIQATVQEKITGRYWYLFPKNNILLYPRQGIESALRAHYPTLAEASVGAENLHTLGITVVERQPAALWCGQDFSAENNCSFMDASGLVYAPAAQFEGDAYQKYFGALASPESLGQYLTPEQFHSLSALAQALAAKVPGDPVAGLWVESDGDAHLIFNSGFTLLFNSTDDTGAVFNRFSLALTAAPFTAHPASSFEYLDLRFGNKLYYKLKSS